MTRGCWVLLCLGALVACSRPDGEPDPSPASGSGREPTPGLVYVPGATYPMGTDLTELPGIAAEMGIDREELFSSEVPRHDVTVEPFLLEETDVTNAAFREFTVAVPEWAPSAADPSLHNGRYLEHWVGGGPRAEDRARPVTFVTWYAAVAYCSWRGRRLPTEIEWEHAARGGDPDAVFPWGRASPHDSLVSWGADGIDHPVDVASYPPNGFGLYDMSGNVWKYLADEWHGSYADTPMSQLTLSADTAARVRTRRVVRGGSWGAAAANLRIRYRDSHRPSDAREMVGFRCAMSID